MFELIQPDIQRAKGRADHDVWRLFPNRGKHRTEIAEDSCRRIYRRARLTPSQTGPVVRAHAVSPGNLRLNQREIESERACARFNDNGWGTAASAIDVQLPSSNINQATRRPSDAGFLPKKRCARRE